MRLTLAPISYLNALAATHQCLAHFAVAGWYSALASVAFFSLHSHGN